MALRCIVKNLNPTNDSIWHLCCYLVLPFIMLNLLQHKYDWYNWFVFFFKKSFETNSIMILNQSQMLRTNLKFLITPRRFKDMFCVLSRIYFGTCSNTNNYCFHPINARCTNLLNNLACVLFNLYLSFIVLFVIVRKQLQ